MSKRKKILKIVKYVVSVFIILTIIGGVITYRDGQRMYGAYTERIDSNTFKFFKDAVAIENVNILSSDGDSIIRNQTVLLEEGIIIDIDSVLNLPREVKTIDGTDKYLIPGLIDTHVHLFQSPNDLLLYVANGVTEIRELIGEEDHLKWRDEIENNERIGPKMIVYSPRLGSFGSLEGWFMEYSQGYENIESREDAVAKTKAFYDQGYDGIKVYSQVTKDVYLGITEAANALGMPVVGHIPWKVGLKDIWENGQSNIVHFEELMNALSREFNEKKVLGGFFGKEEEFLKFVNKRKNEVADNLVKHNISITSTLWLTESFAQQPFKIEKVLSAVQLKYENPGIAEGVSYIPQALGWLPDVNRYKLPENMTEDEKKEYQKFWTTYAKACQIIATACIEKGVMIMTGTDANLPPVVPGFSLHDELLSLTNAGMTNADVLKSATAIPASYLGSKSGVIQKGYNANLLLLDKNPLENIENTKTIHSVILNGKVLDRKVLDEILSSVEQMNDASRKVNIDVYRK